MELKWLRLSLFRCLGKGADDDLLEPALHVVVVAAVLAERAVGFDGADGAEHEVGVICL